MAGLGKARASEPRQIASKGKRDSAVFFGRGSWIRTNDLQYPKLPRYQAALYPDLWETSSIHASSAASKTEAFSSKACPPDLIRAPGSGSREENAPKQKISALKD
jgi:hypothetical protein